MRKILWAVPILLILSGFVLPAWGETPSAPLVPLVKTCPASTAATALPRLLPQPFFKTTFPCGHSCSDPGCNNTNSKIGDSCSAQGAPGVCTGLIVGGHPLTCDGAYQCACIGED